MTYHVPKHRARQYKSKGPYDPRTTLPSWAYCTPQLRDEIIAAFEAAMLEAYGVFPKPAHMPK